MTKREMKKELKKAENPNTEEVAIRVENLSKTFRVPHEKNTSIKGAALNMFRGKKYEKFEALKDVSFEVKKGEFFGIIGRNGSGKSTLLKILAGIYVPDSGKVTINGKLSPFLELGVGFNPELTGKENLFLGGSILGLTRKEVEEKYEKIVKFAELEDFIDMKLKNYSSGMQVRLAFSLAINAHAEILLMDEVLAVGDTNFQAKCIDEFRKYRSQGKTVVLVTHDITVVRQYCDRAMLLRRGKVVLIESANKASAAYIEQNIGDESESSSEGDASVSHKYIKKVVLRDTKAKVVNYYKNNEEILIDVVYALESPIDSPIFGITIRDSDKHPVFVTNTLFMDVKTPNNMKGEFKVSFKVENLLASGRYNLTVAIADKSKRILDWCEDVTSFRVVKEYDSSGVVDLPHEILIEKNGA